MSKQHDPKKCQRCDGAGEEYRPDLRYSDGPWAPCIGCHGYGFEQSDSSLRHCTAVLGAYWRDGWPAFYKADVEVHDMNELAERSPDLPFGWITRDSGSALVFPEDFAPRGFSGDYIRQVGREGQRCYWWDGRALREVGGDQLAEYVAMERDRIQRRRDRDRRQAA